MEFESKNIELTTQLIKKNQSQFDNKKLDDVSDFLIF